MWIFLVTVTMLFAAFTSALVVARADAMIKGTWMSYHIPFPFTISTILIILSSASLLWATNAAKKNEIEQNRVALWLTFFLGTGFLICQCFGYLALIDEKVFIVGNNSGASFFYVISGVHALHLVGGLCILIATLISAYQYKVHSRNMLRISLCATYWHFIGGLWVYLFILLNILR
jgi:cytochrome c oxidase subunit 3